VKICGLQKLTLLDFPGRLGAIVFLGGCNFRCPFCQNSSLVLSPGDVEGISEEEFRRFLKKRSGIIEGICVTGGEPTLHQDLSQLFSLIKSEGYLAKLDTNGTNPDMVRTLIEDGLVDYVAMDLKAGREHYARICGLDGQSDERNALLLENICQSVELLMDSSIEYEFRTTVVKGLHSEQDFIDIAQWISGCRNYFLQSFRDCDEVLMQNHSFSAFSEDEMRHFLRIVQKEIPQASLRGV
jgi:pyruvate formate lyase activating enzyme